MNICQDSVRDVRKNRRNVCMVRRVILLACAGILVISMSACGKSQEAAKHQIEGSHVVSAESSVSTS